MFCHAGCDALRDRAKIALCGVVDPANEVVGDEDGLHVDGLQGGDGDGHGLGLGGLDIGGGGGFFGFGFGGGSGGDVHHHWNIDARGTDPALSAANFQRALEQTHRQAVHDSTMITAERQRRTPH